MRYGDKKTDDTYPQPQISLVISDKARPLGQYVDFTAPCADYSLIFYNYIKFFHFSQVLLKNYFGTISLECPKK